MAENKKIKYGVFLGSFDPVHNGHEKLVRDTLKYNSINGIETIIIVPAQQNPSKPQSTPLDMRIDMLKLAFKDLIEDGKVIIEDIEKDISVETGLFTIPSYLTVAELGKKYGQFYIITTVETLRTVKDWIRGEFFTHYHYIVHNFADDGATIDKELYSLYPHIEEVLCDEHKPIHAAMIRKGSESFRKKHLRKEVYDYIKEHELYKVGRNWPYTIKEGEHKGVTLYSGRNSACCGITISRGFSITLEGDKVDKFYILANLRGDGCPDYNGYWNIPCGFIELNENGEEATCREILEECGLVITPDKFTQVYTETEPAFCNNGNITIRYIACVDNLHYEHLIAPNGEENEVSSVKWIPLTEIENYKWAFNHYQILKNIRKNIHEIYAKFNKEGKGNSESNCFGC